jgi:hypothetical protein
MWQTLEAINYVCPYILSMCICCDYVMESTLKVYPYLGFSIKKVKKIIPKCVLINTLFTLQVGSVITPKFATVKYQCSCHTTTCIILV